MGTTVSFLLMLKEEVLLFPEGRVVDLNTTPAAAIASRRTGPDVFVDEYTTSIAPESSKYREQISKIRTCSSANCVCLTIFEQLLSKQG